MALDHWEDPETFDVLRDKINLIVDAVNAIVSVPIGGIQMYFGSPADATKWDGSGIGVAGTQYEKFALCLGQGLTGSELQNYAGDALATAPDFRGKFPAGYDTLNAKFPTIGHTGGAETVELTEAEMPRHRHPMVIDDNINGGGDNPIGLGDGDAAFLKHTKYTGGVGVLEAASDGAPHENLPPYLATGFIIRYK